VTWTQNDLQLVLNNSKLLEILRDTLDICLLYLFKISTLLMMTTKCYHFQKKLTSNWNWNFKCLDLSQYRSKWHEISFTYILFMIYKIPKLQIQKCSNKGDMTKKLDLTQSSKVHNSHKTYIFLLKILE